MLTIYAIGYGNRNINIFLSLIKEYGIDLVLDVRSNPVSRFNPEYRRDILSNTLARERVQYRYMGAELGGKPKSKEYYKNGKLDYGFIKESSLYKDGIAHVKQLAENNTVCLMCCELRPDICHRKTLIGASLLEENINVLHINERGFFVPHLI